ncbi:MAG: PorT family protein [Bacteroidaceae bacterium]|nr:PorT family protein [Bacteroidaceae bacterium]
MKKLLLALAALTVALGMNAQTPEKGTLMLRPMAGISISTWNYSQELTFGGETVSSLKSNAKAGFTGGAEFGFQALKWLQPSVGLFYQQQGSKFNLTQNGETQDSKENFNYLTVPVLANFYVANGLALKVGVMPGFLLSAKETIGDLTSDINKDLSENFQMQIPVGISYEFCKFIVDARVNIPVTKCTGQTNFDTAFDNLTFAVSLGYNFEF